MDLIEIFKAGTHTDSSGQTREWTEKDLEEIASLYNPANHEAPIVIGHPETDSPAYGWVESLKAEGGKLLAKLKDVAPEFKDWVSRGLYKKVSVALYPDLGLRHVGFLGATPPAVKGLRQATFTEKAAWIIVEDIKMASGPEGALSEPEALPSRRPARWADQSTEKQSQEARSKKYNIAIKDGGHVTKPGEWSSVPDDDFLDPVNYRYPCPNADQTRAAAAYWGKPDNQAQYSSEERALISKRLAAKEKQYKIGEHSEKGGTKMTVKEFLEKMKGLFTEVEKDLSDTDHGHGHEARFTEADVEAKVKQVKDLAFAEAEKLKKEKSDAEAKVKKIEDEKRKSEIVSFCEALCKEGKLTPALRKIIEPIMIAVSDQAAPIEFSETVKKTALEGIKDFLTEIPKVVTFKEVAGGAGPGSNGSAAEKLSALTKKKMDGNKDLSYSMAFREVQKENPELAREYSEKIRPK